MIPIKNKKSKPLKKSLLERTSESIDLPKTLTMQLPRLIFTGHREVYIENFRGILEYGAECIRIATAAKSLCICGRALTIKSIASEEITIEGDLSSVTFEGSAD